MDYSGPNTTSGNVHGLMPPQKVKAKKPKTIPAKAIHTKLALTKGRPPR